MVDDCGGSSGGAVCAAQEALTLQPFKWFEGVGNGLSRALGEYGDAIRDGVKKGRMALWRVGGHSWAVVEARDDTLICWCYEGRDVMRFADALCRIAAANGFAVVEYTTPHRALCRMTRRAGFELASIIDGNLYRMQAAI